MLYPNPLKQTFYNLACSLYAGSVLLDELEFEISPEQIQDEAYLKFQVQQTLRQERLWAGGVISEVTAQLKQFFTSAKVKGVVLWEP